MTFRDAERVADAVLYEGYLLYPYRASSVKNQVRWQFGVLMPRGFAEADGSERWRMRTECLVRADGAATVDMRVRFLRLQARALEAVAEDGSSSETDTVEIDGEPLLAWEEAVEETIDAEGIALDGLVAEQVVPIGLDEGREVEEVRDREGTVRGRITRTRSSLSGRVVIGIDDAGGGLRRLGVAIENETAWRPDEPGRAVALRGAMLGVHTLIAVRGGTFVSLLEPPAEAAEAAAACTNDGTWPVLVGTDATVMLSSPIILYDQPTIAPESPGDLFDATEIDEILTLRIMTLTDEEKRERVDPHAAMVDVGGTQVGRGAMVRLRPGPRGDSMDMFLAGRIGRIEGVWETLEDEPYVAITLVDDPASEEHAWVGRYLYFRPTELEPAAEMS
ncbi:MAG: hypothetical protein LC798_07760 [Chloroflexi bacterium]|nr:hypothetical protein [Chloroflexota bacterium]